MANLSLTDDQVFLITFIFSVYFGPDMKKGPIISTSERVYLQLPPYEHNDLSCSNIRLTELERIFHYILRKGDKAHEIELCTLHGYLYGNFPEQLKEKYQYFSQFFPAHLHPYVDFNVVNMAFVHNPNISHIKKNIVERFKNLSGLQDLVLDRNAALSFNFIDYDVPNPIPFQVAQPVEQYPLSKPQSNNAGMQGRKPKKSNVVSNNNYVLPAPAAAQPPRMVSGDNRRVVILALPSSNSPLMRRHRKFKKAKEALPSLANIPSGTEEIPTNNIITDQNQKGIGFTGNTSTVGAAPRPPGLLDGAKSEDPHRFRFSHPELFNCGGLGAPALEDEQVPIQECTRVLKQSSKLGPSSSS